MSATLTPIDTLDTLEAALTGSATRPLLIFKHSLTCGTSAWAREELDALLDDAPLQADVRIVHIQTSRAVSSAVAERLGIRHESPQALLVVDGRVVWHASHHMLTHDAMAAAVAAAVAP